MKTLSLPLCSLCGAEVNGEGICVACLLSVGLDEPAAEESPAYISLVFGDFEIAQHEDGSLWELGRGAMGVTYLATDKVLHRHVALKVIETPGAADGSRAVRERFLREARAAAALRHPNVAGVFQFGASPEVDRCYYAMELLEGETLQARVRRDGPLKVETALEMAIQVARALLAAAAQGLIHRDLKPGNIMLTPADGATQKLEVKVIDFGLAKATADSAGEMDLTRDGFVGTPSFASPEQFEHGPVDARSDIYSLGVTLWYALTGEVPCPGKTMEEIRASQNRANLPVKQLATRKVPAQVVKLLSRTLSVEPARRPASARELLEDLESCRRRLARGNGIRPFHKLIALTVVLMIAAAALFMLRLNRQKVTFAVTSNTPRSLSVLAPLPEKSIAVLPFDNLSKDEANTYFAAGVQDELLSDLARIADLKVISRISVMRYKNTERNLRDIGRALGVAHIVEGSVQRAGNRIRVNAQLVDTRTDAHLWAQTYDGELVDIFGIQSEIAQRIADQLRAKISHSERAAILEQPTTDLTAYALYTEAKAASVWADWKKERIKPRLLELLHEAIRRDPNFVLAYCFLAEVYSHEHGAAQRTGYESGTVDELWKQAIDNAMRLRPDLGEPHVALARYHFFLNHFDAARDELTIARRLLPNNSDAIFIAARIDRRQNRWEESLAGVRKAHELDPRNPDIIAWTCEMYRLMRRYSEGEQFVSEAMARMPEITSWLNVQLAELKLREGDPRAAQEIVARVPQVTGGGDVRFKTALYLRDYDTAAKVIATAPAEEAEEDFDGKPPRSFADGQLARARGDNAAAQAVFRGAREDWDDPTAHHRRDEAYFTEIALLDAGLGRKEEAIREAQHAVELLPISQDALFGPDMVRNLAWVYAWTGEPNLAIEKLEMLSKIPGDVSYGDLRFNPCWDSLRGDPRFEEMVAGLAPKAANHTTSLASTLTQLPEKSIAVLPFANFSPDKENAFFADGIQDDILTSLGKISDLKVISRTSSSQYRGTGAARNLREIAQALGVENILEGSVRRIGNRVLVNVQLIDARNDRHIWSERYDRTVVDAIGLQGELATQIAAVLKAKLAPEEKARLEAKPTDNPDAYALYLKALAREAAVNHSTEDAIAAEQFYAQAIALDPKFALAHARLSIVDSNLSYGMADFARRAKARAAAEEALRLAPSLGQAHTALGLCLYWADKDYAAALKEFSIAAVTSPNEPDILHYLAGIYRRQGRWRESLATYQRAQDLDPRNRKIIVFAAMNHLLVRDWPGATAYYNRALEIAPDSAYAKIGLAYLEVFRNSNPASGSKILQDIPAATDPDGLVTVARWDLAMLKRDYATAEKILAAFPLKGFPQAGNAPKTLYQGRTALAQGNIESAQRYFAAALPSIEGWVRQDLDDLDRHEQLGLVYGYMHRKEDAIRESRRGVELEPESQNAFHGAARAGTLAMVYVLTGEADQAITLIERLLSTPGPAQPGDFPGNITLADLRLRWEWDSLRNDPRFQKILADPEPKTVYN